MLAPLAEIRREGALLAFSVRARDYYHELATDLRENTGVDVGLWTEGVVQLACSEEEVIRLKAEIGWQRQQGYNADWLTSEDLLELCPGVTPEAVGALLAPEDGALDPTALHEALLKSATEHGAKVDRGRRVDGITIEAGKVGGVRVGTETIAAGAVVVSAGCWSGTLAGLPRPLSVEPIRGQMIAYPWPEGEPPAIVYGGKGYVMCRGVNALAGSTMEHVGFDASNTEEGTDHVARSAAQIYPALKGAVRTKSWAGLRPVTPDGHPILGPDPHAEGLWYATGHGRNGILLAGMTGALLANMMAGEEVEYDLSPMDPARFWRF
jgi:glycine oxidase